MLWKAERCFDYKLSFYHTHTEKTQRKTFIGTLTCCQGLRSLYSSSLDGNVFYTIKQLSFVCLHAPHIRISVWARPLYYVRRFLENLMCSSVFCQSLIRGLKPPCHWQKIPFVPFFTASRKIARVVAAQQGHYANGSWLIVGEGVSVISLNSCFFVFFKRSLKSF